MKKKEKNESAGKMSHCWLKAESSSVQVSGGHGKFNNSSIPDNAMGRINQASQMSPLLINNSKDL